MTEQTTPTVRCENCEQILDSETLIPLDEVEDLLLRIEPGEVVPAGECSHCGALAHLVTEEVV